MLPRVLGVAAVVIDMLAWGLIGPFVGLTVWGCGRLIVALCRNVVSEDLPLWLDTPWDTICFMYLHAHGVRVVDCEPGAHTLECPGIRSLRGAFLMNHRSWGDFVIDPFQSHAPPVARKEAVAVSLLTGLIGLASRRVIMIDRRTTTREQLKKMCSTHERWLLYPEGTRRAAQPNADEVVALKAGGLKNIYELGIAAHIVITVGKEDIVNEKAGRLSCHTTLYRARARPVASAEHETFEAFLAAVEQTWAETWRRAYRLRDEKRVEALAKQNAAQHGGSDSDDVALL